MEKNAYANNLFLNSPQRPPCRARWDADLKLLGKRVGLHELHKNNTTKAYSFWGLSWLNVQSEGGAYATMPTCSTDRNLGRDQVRQPTLNHTRPPRPADNASVARRRASPRCTTPTRRTPTETGAAIRRAANAGPAKPPRTQGGAAIRPAAYAEPSQTTAPANDIYDMWQPTLNHIRSPQLSTRPTHQLPNNPPTPGNLHKPDSAEHD